MPDQPTTTEQRLREIIDAFSKITDRVQIIVFRNSLTPQELKDLDTYIKGLPKTLKPLPPKAPTDILPDFIKWSVGRIGLTPQELIQNYIDTHNLTNKDLFNLEEALKKQGLADAAAKAVVEQGISLKPLGTIAPELIIKRTPYPKWWNDEGIAKIAFTSPGSQFIVTARTDYSLYIATIVLTVSGEVNITFTFGQAGASGPMDFGGDQEPRGIVIAMGNSPTPCGSGSFMVTGDSGNSVNVNGYVSYYLWKKEAQQ